MRDSLEGKIYFDANHLLCELANARIEEKKLWTPRWVASGTALSIDIARAPTGFGDTRELFYLLDLRRIGKVWISNLERLNLKPIAYAGRECIRLEENTVRDNTPVRLVQILDPQRDFALLKTEEVRLSKRGAEEEKPMRVTTYGYWQKKGLKKWTLCKYHQVARDSSRGSWEVEITNISLKRPSAKLFTLYIFAYPGGGTLTDHRGEKNKEYRIPVYGLRNLVDPTPAPPFTPKEIDLPSDLAKQLLKEIAAETGIPTSRPAPSVPYVLSGLQPTKIASVSPYPVATPQASPYPVAAPQASTYPVAIPPPYPVAAPRAESKPRPGPEITVKADSLTFDAGNSRLEIGKTPATQPRTFIPVPPRPSNQNARSSKALVSASPSYSREVKRELTFEGKTFEHWKHISLTELSPEMRVRAIEALLAFGQAGRAKEAAAAIQSALEQVKDPDVIAEGHISLLNLGPAGLPVLMESLKSKNVQFQRCAARLLGQYKPVLLKGELSVPEQIILALLQTTEDEDETVRKTAYQSLGQLAQTAEAKKHADRIVPALIKALEDPSSGVQISTIQALGKYGARAKSAVPALKKLSLKTSLSQQAKAALEKIKGKNPPPAKGESPKRPGTVTEKYSR